MSYPDGFHVRPLGDGCSTERLAVNPLDDVPQTLGCRDDVERRWHGAAFLEVADP